MRSVDSISNFQQILRTSFTLSATAQRRMKVYSIHGEEEEGLTEKIN